MALLFTLLLAVSACGLIYLLADFGKADFLHETEAAIDSETTMLSSLKNAQTNILISYINQRSKDDPAVRFRYEDEGGKLRAGTIAPMPTKIHRMAEGILRFDLDTGLDQKTYAFKIHTFGDGTRIIVARNIHAYITHTNRLWRLSALIFFLMFCVVMVSFAISFFVVSRINRIAATAQEIVETGDISQRLFIDSRWDDLSSLSQTLNGFLDKIENLMIGMREVSNNIAHDLRTPLSSLRNDIEALKGQPADDIKIDGLLADADRILAIFQALLRITNIEKGARSQHLIAVDLTVVLDDVIELYEPVAEERNIVLDRKIEGPLVIRGDRDLLFQMLANLIDNALKFAPAGSVLFLAARQAGGDITVSVQDQGQGIPDDEKAKVFHHFYRGTSSRTLSDDKPGHGLGLSLVKAIAELHQAVIDLEDTQPGLRVRIRFQPYQEFRIW